MVTSPQQQQHIDQAYSDGIADIIEKVLGLIYQTDGNITIAELAEFLDEERQRELVLAEPPNV